MWIVFALAAAILWGVTYALNEKAFEHISIATTLAIGTFCAAITMAIMSFVQGNLLPDMHVIANSKKVFWLVTISTITFVMADWLIALSINAKNATLASLIEITYPIFVSLFAFLFFREVQLNLTIMIGGLFTFAGIAITYLGNR